MVSETRESLLDLVIRGATLYDGTGAPGFPADVGVHGDRIVAVGRPDVDSPVSPGAVELDARGLAVAPGFIDVHSHDDFAVLLEPTMSFKIMQGVTTEVVGNCGAGPAPYGAARRRFAEMHPGPAPARWSGLGGYLARVDEVGPSLNVAALLGHNVLRSAVMGNADRRPSDAELDQMRRWVRQGVAEGAVGMSTGLIYEPGCHATTEELVALAQELGGSGGGVYATHLRDEAGGLLASVREAIEIGEEADVSVQISHHKAAGRSNRGLVNQSLRLIEEARDRGVDVTADQY
ncbi:MAG: N-acyl-D-amino-acid deacylase family protein, partial [Acidimicrobiia bacterium]